MDSGTGEGDKRKGKKKKKKKEIRGSHDCQYLPTDQEKEANEARLKGVHPEKPKRIGRENNKEAGYILRQTPP